MTFEQAAKYKLPHWADFPGKTIDEVAVTDFGLRKLDKLLGWHEDKNIKNSFARALGTYLNDPSIKKELEV